MKIPIVVLIIPSCIACLAGDTNKPLALRKAAEARSSNVLHTARIEYSVTDVEEDQSYTQFSSFTAANNDFITVLRGDEKGVVAYQQDGQPAPALLNKPWHCLLKEGEVWRRQEDSPDAQVADEFPARSALSMHDIRALGLNPVMPERDLDEYLRELGRPPLTYDSELVGGLHVVRGRTSESMFEWWIDPERDWNIVKTVVYGEGGSKKIAEERFTLRFDLRDGVWFPSRMELWSHLPGVKNPRKVIDIHAVEFNRPEHSVALKPSDIGVETGTFVTYENRKENAMGYWDGEKIASAAEFRERINSGELAVGPNTARALALEKVGKQFDSGAPKYALTTDENNEPRYIFQWQSYETEWEAYTRRFIARYKLDEEQSQKAWAICNDCQERGRAYVAKRKPVLEEIDKRLRKLASAATEEAAAQRQRLENEKAHNLEPLTMIFEEQLKPRLDKLPTRAQRRAAEFESAPVQK